jgi:ferritin-like metal-binding protein YciE
MGFFSKDIKTMDDLFVHTLQDIYYAEKQIVQSLRPLSMRRCGCHACRRTVSS